MRAVALDLDGTLLNPNQTVDEETKDLLKKLHLSGVAIGIATGREFSVVQEVLASNEMHPKSGFPHFIISDERDVHFLEGGLYSPWRDWNDAAFSLEIASLQTARDVAAEASYELEHWFLINNPYLQTSRGYVEIFFRHAEDASRFLPWFEERLEGLPLVAVRNNRLIALRSPVAGKGRVLEKVVARLGVPPQELLAVGDSHNDHDMLARNFAAATTSNADEDIKALVRHRGGMVASGSYSAGVAELLKKSFSAVEVAKQGGRGLRNTH